MDFKDSNENRPFHMVKGRVIVATTSRCVEFLEHGLKFSYPLYSVPYIAPGYLLTFMVELNGYLTFDPGSYFKVTQEAGPYKQLHYDPSAFALVRAADTPAPRVITYMVMQGQGNSQYDMRYYLRWSDGYTQTCAGPPTYNLADFVGKDQANAELFGLQFSYGDI